MTKLIEWFRHIVKDREHICENCGKRIYDCNLKNVAHILPKSKFPSVKMNDLNCMILCTSLDQPYGTLGCHEKFDDQPHEKVKKEKMWKIAVKRFRQFEDDVKEKNTLLWKYWDAKI